MSYISDCFTLFPIDPADELSTSQELPLVKAQRDMACAEVDRLRASNEFANFERQVKVNESLRQQLTDANTESARLRADNLALKREKHGTPRFSSQGEPLESTEYYRDTLILIRQQLTAATSSIASALSKLNEVEKYVQTIKNGVPIRIVCGVVDACKILGHPKYNP